MHKNKILRYESMSLNKKCRKNMHEIVDVERVAKKLFRKEKVDPALAQSVALLHHNQDEYCIVPAKQRSRRGRR